MTLRTSLSLISAYALLLDKIHLKNVAAEKKVVIEADTDFIIEEPNTKQYYQNFLNEAGEIEIPRYKMDHLS